MLCPRCDQGDISKAKITKKGREIFVCKECEATWFCKSAIGTLPFVDYNTYMEEIGLPPLWDELCIEER